MRKIGLSGWVIMLLLSGCSYANEPDQLPLIALITTTDQHLVIQNGDAIVWKNATITIDDRYTYHAERVPRGSESIPYTSFIDENGQAFHPGLLKIRKVKIHVPNFVGDKNGTFKW
jgi:hypothetical protein